MMRMPVERLTPERRRELTRTALVEAAVEVFAKRGFHAASLDEIAQTAGFTRGAIYSNFDGKEDLFLEVLDMLMDRQLTQFAQAMEEAPGHSNRDLSTAASGVWSRTVRSDKTLATLSLEMRLYAMRNVHFRKRLAEAERRLIDRIAGFAEEMANLQGRSLRFPARELAEIMSATSVGLSQVSAIDPENGDYYDRVAQMFFVLIGETAVSSSSDAAAKR
jgi:AcrR family transcriptional regulator